MRNSIVFTILILLASFSLSGCSLFSSDGDEQETATVAEADEASGSDGYADDDFEDDESDEDDEEDSDSSEVASSDDNYESDDDDEDEDEDSEEEVVSVADSDTQNEVAVEDGFGDSDVDEYPDDDYSGDEVASTEDSVFVDEGGGIPEDTMESNQEDDLFVREDEAPVVDEPVFADATDYTEPVVDSPKWVPVKKMKPEAFQRAGYNVNRLYVVRSGDDMRSVASKVGMSTEALYSIHPHFVNRSLSVGDKVYYSSSRSPNDTSMKTYYEDMNIPPQFYTSQNGENIRKISKKLLGHNNSWMEVWATNQDVTSKDGLPSGTQLRYWPSGSDVQMAEAEVPMKKEPIVPPAPTIEEPVEAPQEMAEVQEEVIETIEEVPEVQEVAQVEQAPAFEETVEEIPAPSDSDFNPPPAAGQVNNNPPPPKAMAPPPPPPPPAPMARKQRPNPDAPMQGSDSAQDLLASAQDDQMIMGALIGCSLLVLLILLVFIRRSRAKRVNFSQTQV